MRRKRHSIIAALLFSLGCAAPATVSKAELLEEAEQLCLDARFAEAEPLLRECLRRDPTDAVAHYYLGRCYLSGDLINLDLARGEITAALSLYYAFGQSSPQKRFTEEYFQLMCLTDIGKTYLSEIALEIPLMKLSPAERKREVQERITRCNDLYERAKRINPDAHLTDWLKLRIAEAAASMGVQQH